ncbi:MAG: c-type cytochrome [Magnetococcales bacterium]|nr:c-type cytochrome [Magnetococcales bacterium]
MNGWGLIPCILVLFGGVAGCTHGQEVKNGQKIAEEFCAPCHDLTSGSSIHHGPPLWGLVGRPVGQVEGFNYSPSFQERRKKGDLRWTVENLDRFLEDPRGLIPNNRMSAWDPGISATSGFSESGKSLELVRASLASEGHYEPFDGFRKPSERRDLIAYLKTLTRQPGGDLNGDHVP